MNGKDTTRKDQALLLTMGSSCASMNVLDLKDNDPSWFSELDLRYMKNISFDDAAIDFDGDAHFKRRYEQYDLFVSTIRKPDSLWGWQGCPGLSVSMLVACCKMLTYVEDYDPLLLLILRCYKGKCSGKQNPGIILIPGFLSSGVRI